MAYRKEYMKEYRAKNKERTREYYVKHKKAYMKEYYIKNKEHKKEYNRKQYEKNRASTPERIAYKRNYQLTWNYGISLEDYNKMFTEQNGCCAICGKHQSDLNKGLVVDHDHITNKIRGLLCDNCNRGLGAFHDNILSIKMAIKYLLDSGKKET